MGANIFNTIMVKAPQYNSFDLSHDVKFSARMGELVPVLCHEVVPGDKFKIGADTLVRFAPLIAPVMHRFDATIHYFFVPNRIVWENFPKFISNETGFIAPYMSKAYSDITPEQRRFMDYMGVPPASGLTTIPINALPFAAYQCIYNEYYRDQNLIDEVDYKLEDGYVGDDQFAALTTMRKRAWEHDYFTSSLPFAQKGQDVVIPLGDVTLKDNWDNGFPHPSFKDGDNNRLDGQTVVTDADEGYIKGATSADVPHAYDPAGSLEVGATTINNLRRAFRLQEWLEKMARGGSRYIETILSHFGVRSSDKRLQRPEYITGTKQPIVVSEVLNTSGQVLPDGEAGDPLPQGNMAGHAVSVSQGQSGSYYAEEHGFIIGIFNVRPKPAYMQGLPRMYRKLDVFDYYWPSFANIGEQEVKNSEIYYPTNTPDGTFGYVPRYAEYRYIPSRVAGQFRTTLDYWHLARKFSTTPQLNQEFIECDPDDLTRIFAVESGEDELFCHILHKIYARRPLPVYGTPMM